MLYFSPSLNNPEAYAQQLRYKGFLTAAEGRRFEVVTNQEEISEYLGCEVSNIDEAITKAQIFADHGITMDADAPLTRGETAQVLYAVSQLAVDAPGMQAIRMQK